MSQEPILYTISIYSENNVGLLNRISAIFLKRHINIESLTTSLSEIPDVFRFVIVVMVTEPQAQKLVQQIEKQVDVIKAFYHTDEETIFLETALYKVKLAFIRGAADSKFYQREPRQYCDGFSGVFVIEKPDLDTRQTP
jgi:acetolactate synthase, small subunit